MGPKKSIWTGLPRIKGTVCPIGSYEVDTKVADCVGDPNCSILCSSCLNFTGDITKIKQAEAEEKSEDKIFSVDIKFLEETWNAGAACGDTCLPEAKESFDYMIDRVYGVKTSTVGEKESYLENHCPTGNFDEYFQSGSCTGCDTCLLCKKCNNLVK